VVRGGLKRQHKCHINRAEKASIPLKMYLKSLAIFEKASISLKKASKIIEIFIKALQEAFIPLGMSSKSPLIFIKSSY
jgi:hypothetical protein